jgi:glutaredoxin
MIVTATNRRFCEHETQSLASTSVVLYSTSTPSTLRVKRDIRRFLQLLHALQIQTPFQYQIVDLAETPSRKIEMMSAVGGSDDTLPQLHVNGSVVGDMRKVEELHDFGVTSPSRMGVAHKFAGMRRKCRQLIICCISDVIPLVVLQELVPLLCGQ